MLKEYTVIVGRPDYVADDQLTDTYMTSLHAENAAQAGEFACREAAEQDNVAGEEPNDPDDYVVVATILGNHQDISGRTDA